jgi:transposase
MIAHNVPAIAELTQRIKALDASINRLAPERYPETIYLEHVNGVGPITSLYVVLKVGSPERFQRTRDIGAFLGLCPKRDQSGETDKELRISEMRRPIPETPAGERRAVYSGTPSSVVSLNYDIS